jgi:hypothetical protein
VANIFSRFLGRTASEGAAFSLGHATGPVLVPAVELLRQEAWRRTDVAALDPMSLAQGVAEGQIERTWAQEEAQRSGINFERFDRLVQVFDSGPGVGQAYRLWRRGVLTEAGFRRALKRAALEDEWIDALVAARDELLTPDQLANARQQGFVSEPRQKAESERQGVTDDRAEILFELAGLPPGAMDGLTMLRRGIIDEATYRQIVREGHTKVKYTDDLLALREHILTATDAANLWLKGWISEAEAKRIGALNGYDAATMDRLYENRGRPATVRQAHIGYARGGRLPGAASEDATLDRAIKESNIRSEWADILKAQRYTYPSAFVLRALASDGTFSPALTEQILVESGWKPEWSKLAAQKWAQGAGAGGTAQKWADRARTRLFTAAHQEFLDESITEARARTILGEIGVGSGEQDAVIRLWEAELGITRRELSPADIRKAYKKGAYTQEQAISELIERHMSPDDADTYLQSA